MTREVRRARPERFGALVQVESPTALVAVDRQEAQRLGVDGGALWETPDVGLDVPQLSAPAEVHLSVTERCPVGCRGCYVDATAQGHAPSLENLKARLDALAAQGVFNVAFGGGEPLTRADMGALGAHARSVGLVPTLTTSGLGLSASRAAELRPFAQVNVSHDGAGEGFAAVRGFDASATAEAAVEALVAAGVRTGLNCVVTRRNFDALGALVERARALGAAELQLLRLKPSGRGKAIYLEERLLPAQVQRFPETLQSLVSAQGPAIRIDCAMVPFLTAGDRVPPEALRRFGVMGCEAGRSLMTADARGAAAPCSFWEQPGEPVADAWTDDAQLGAFRRYHAAPPEPCRDCSYRAACRGGCRIVAREVCGDAWQPDPECPRVQAYMGKPRTAAT